ncbi:N-methyltransferase tcpN [Cladobotryum mycophilum]|uniref:N-methyltransferase tcpN n=1 Tax=Cladobotryum mycophilum TaxID=491253 RepID=A0ABR0SJA1_9HYPO
MSTETVYILNNGAKGIEEDRLAYQHGVLLDTTKTIIPNNIAEHLASLGRPPAIADIGTGTAIWLQDLAPLLSPDSRLDGYDYDTTKFPEASELPDNVKLTFADFFKPFPTELLGTYDFVHIRLLMYALKAEQWKAVATNLRTLLRPGGFLMWDELGYPTWQCLPMTEPFLKWLGTDMRYGISVGRDIKSPLGLRGQLERLGFTQCTQQEFSTYSEPAEFYKRAGHLLLNVGFQALNGILAAGGFEWVQSSSEIDDLFSALRKDVDDGAVSLGFVVYWIVGRKPEE